MLNMKKVELELISDGDMFYSLKKVWVSKFLTFLRDIVNQTIKIWNIMTENKNQNMLYT